MSIAIPQGRYCEPVFCDPLAERSDSCGRVRAGNTVGVRVGDARHPASGRGLLEQVCLRMITNVGEFDEWRSMPSALLGLIAEGLADTAGLPPIIQRSQSFDC